MGKPSPARPCPYEREKKRGGGGEEGRAFVLPLLFPCRWNEKKKGEEEGRGEGFLPVVSFAQKGRKKEEILSAGHDGRTQKRKKGEGEG